VEHRAVNTDRVFDTPHVEDGMEELRATIRSGGFGQALGFGRRPGVVVVDFSRAFTDADSGLGADASDELTATRRLLDCARAANVPVLFTSIAYDEAQMAHSLFVRKVPAMRELVMGTPAVEIDPELSPRADEPVIYKHYASAFAGTNLAALLSVLDCDTILLAGVSTSGCIRATAIDAIQYGLRALVVEECVADRWHLSHSLALAEIAGKYGDVIGLDEAMSAVERLGAANRRV
jgi:maleamate amidohydrolase